MTGRKIQLRTLIRGDFHPDIGVASLTSPAMGRVLDVF